MSEYSRREILKAVAATATVASLPMDSRAAGSATPGVPVHGWQYATASEVAQAIKAKQVSSSEITRLALDRIAQLNPKLNAVVTVLAESAMQRAKQADAALAKGEVWGPLHGVPCTIKDTFETEGVRTTAGAPELKDHISKVDAVAVARLRAAGMVLLGKTNTPAWAGDWQTYNDVFGTTNNPWDPTRTPGGSTGGGAAALAAGLGYLTIGSDLAGSIRVPAHFCGVFGHKPSLNVVPFRGHVPPMPGAYVGPTEMAVAGPLARSAQDLLLALRVLGGPLPEDALAYSWRLPPARKSSIREYRIGYVLDHPLCPVTKDVRNRLLAAVEALRSAGARVEEGFPSVVDVREQYKTFLDILWPMDLDDASPEEKARIRALKPASDDLLGLTMQHALDATADDQAKARARRVPMRLAWQRYFEDHDAFLMPTHFMPAFAHDHREPQWTRTLATPEGPRPYFDQNMWASIAIMTGLPATVAPVGLTPSGLPVGIQILGPWLEDATPIYVAGVLEKAFGFQIPKGFE